MSNYIITEADKIELSKFAGCNTLENDYWICCEKRLKKSKWTAVDLRSFNQQIDDGLGHLLYQSNIMLMIEDYIHKGGWKNYIK